MKRYDNFIGGKWSVPVGGQFLDSENPFTRQPWASIARSGVEDVNRAVAAASAAFETGPWRTLSATARGKLLWKMGDLLEANVDRLARLEIGRAHV